MFKSLAAIMPEEITANGWTAMSGGDIGLCSRQFQLARVRQPVCDVGHHVGEPTDREVVAADATPMQAVGHAEWGVVVGDHQ